ncbi:beta and beta-prime subunits of DNA dependent RNA-polymerase [Parathielavia appendiculata]|uniref:DNA-directed RNA polymerase subunit n=1 Tax=Parathielavia appendiculata TaxID=2587402 RepID=A0AAN6TSS2_9PEZI|nr:beta and beta-prime subunits of DNA dependent RNA-polymerase [Parathielavia appendiculata]
MNIAQPVASSLESVEFAHLSAEEIKSISVKRIENDSTFDNLLNPVPGGLYDPALGSWGDSLCRTCNLSQNQCPGHPGHIELPVPVYHPVFMDQAYRLLRSQCVYCYRFRMARHELHKYTCMFRLLQVGLLHEAQMIESFSVSDLGEQLKQLRLSDVPTVEDDQAEEEGGNLHDSTMRARETYVRQVLRNHSLKVSMGDIRKGKHEGAAEMRRALNKELLSRMVKEKRCTSCDGISPVYRKDRWVKIFERDLTEKERAAMAQAGRKRSDALALSRKAEKDDNFHLDEGIDVDSSSEESSGGRDSEGEGDNLDENGDVVMTDAPAKAQRGKSKVSKPAQRYLSTMEVRKRLELLFEKEQELITLLYNSKPQTRASKPLTADMFFITTLLVPPNRYRPEARMGDSQISEAQQNSLYKMILRSASNVAQISREISGQGKDGAEDEGGRTRDMSSLYQAWTELQDVVNSLIDRDKNPVQGAAAKRNEEGIKQKLEKKEGLFRKNMMGKRVNFAARSVISPDPNIETNEIGVPPVFARKLTYPEPVTSHNFKDLQQAVINGVEKWPGASAIENENGQVINLRNKSLEERIALANQLLAPSGNNFSGQRNKKVHRHLTNGDVVLMNRQPTLHKPSIMGHRVRVLPGEKTIRMHYANCNTYNADFDGDEMNMHFPQNEVARVEALQLADTDHQYISGTAGNPLRGLIQDHLSVSVELCNKDTFFDQGAYHQLIYSALRPESGHISGEKIELVPPAIIKPVPRWTGKQVVTTILKNIKPMDCGDLWMNGSAKIKSRSWGEDSEEGQVMFRDGEFISGILDKSQLGSSDGGLVHAVHEVYGPSIAGKLLSSMGRLLTRYLAMIAFTCGMDDLRMTPEGEKNRRETIKAAANIGLEVAAKYVSLAEQKPTKDDPLLLERLEEVLRDDKKQEGLELLTSQECAKLSTEITRLCLPAGLQKQFPKNHMQSMTISGAKGSPVNANLISCNLGQQTLEGRRVPVMVSGRTLPSFKPFDTDVRAGGYIVQRFLTGIRPQEYYFHHMAGREGLIDTAVKTSRSGYLQRCLIKGMEGLRVSYDSTVRDSDGTVVQFLFGEDGIEISKQKYLNDFEFVLRNLDSQLPQIRYHEPGTQALFEHRDEVMKRMKSAIRSANSRNPLDPVASELDPTAFAFATSEKFYSKLMEYVKTNKDGLIKDKKGSDNQKGQIARKTAEKILAAKYIRSLVEPGEAVGIVAGQSVGEPSTQMTLNTFHLAGHSAKNVTLGIPRLREILMTASAKISTPSMTLILNEELSKEDGERFAKSISVLPLAHVTKEAVVQEKVGRGVGYALAKSFQIRLRFFEAEEYVKMYAIDIADVLNTVERKFIPLLSQLTKKEIKKKSKENKAATPDIGVKSGVVEMALSNSERERAPDDDDDDDDVDDDATSAKQKANRSEAVSYGPNDDEDDEIQQQLQRETDDTEEGEERLEFEDSAYGGSPEPEDSSFSDKTDEERSESRAARIKSKNEHVARFRCDESRGEWVEFTLEFDASIPKILMLSLVQEAVKKSVIQQIHRIGTATFEPKKKKDEATGKEHITEMLVHTEGANLRAMQQYGDYINPNRISTNDIAQVLEVYGVEACRSNIVQELSGVFAGHGIAVDPRHLNLIADYMTRNGSFTPFNRIGLTGNVSPFTKMSYETTVSFLKDAVLEGDWDPLDTPSSRLVVGKLGTMGTGSFDVLTRVPTAYKKVAAF